MKDTVVSPICHWAAATPHKTALIATATSFTYAELEAQTTQLAMLLLADGITSGTRVALLLPRGVDAVLAMIAVLKAGATYVLIVTQGTGGSNTLSFSTAYKFPGGSAPVLSTGSSQVDVLSFVSNGTVLYGVASQNFS